MALRILRPILPFALAAIAAAGAPAGDEYPPIGAAGIRARDFRLGEKRSITGKYQELINDQLKLHDFDVRFVVGEPALGRKLLDFKPQKDNLTLRGAFVEGGAAAPDDRSAPAVPTFRVESIEAAPTDKTIFEARLAEIINRPETTARDMEELAEAIAVGVNRFGDESLKPLARQAFSEAFIRSEANLPLDDADGRLALIRKVHEGLKDTPFTLQLLRVQARRFKDHAPTLAFLGELKCYQMEGEWYSYGEFKKKLGFIPVDDRWIKPARQEFETIIEKVRKEKETSTSFILRTKTDREYSLLSHAGKVERGMTREEVGDAIGLPDRVERRSIQGMEVDQWNYPDRRIYLINGQVAVKAP